jgi:catechol 2,3-dioxygenase-like lactoylglutathione lyase family enzyme
MQNLHARTVFFVKDAERSLRFYTEKFGFSLDWNYKENGRAFVFQVSWLGFELILNQAETWTRARIGHGRVFIGLDEEQAVHLQEHIQAKGIETSDFHWGAPTLVIRDIDENELFFWLPQSERDVSET